jgi:23S rRNA (pseudouridine1915-N3)-methyltransferase
LTIEIIIVGKTKEDSLRSLEKSYLQRIARYADIEVTAVRPGKISKGVTAADTLREEAERILHRVRQGDFVIALGSEGVEYTSEQLASLLEKRLFSGARRLVFITGGPLGLDPAVKKRANMMLSFSKMTFTHEMIRILLLEQIYRAWSIIRGEKYHK